jgi:hypothetical protein
MACVSNVSLLFDKEDQQQLLCTKYQGQKWLI